MLRRPKNEAVYTVDVPERDVAIMDARIADVIRRCTYDENIVESVARSCYLQGLADGVQLVGYHPEVLDEVRAQLEGDDDVQAS